MITLATTRTQDVAEVLNSDYHDVTADNVALFKEKHKFIHADFDKMLQKDRGIKCVREYYRYYDAKVCVKS